MGQVCCRPTWPGSDPQIWLSSKAIKILPKHLSTAGFTSWALGNRRKHPVRPHACRCKHGSAREMELYVLFQRRTSADGSHSTNSAVIVGTSGHRIRLIRAGVLYAMSVCRLRARNSSSMCISTNRPSLLWPRQTWFNEDHASHTWSRWFTEQDFRLQVSEKGEVNLEFPCWEQSDDGDVIKTRLSVGWLRFLTKFTLKGK